MCSYSYFFFLCVVMASFLLLHSSCISFGWCSTLWIQDGLCLLQSGSLPPCSLHKLLANDAISSSASLKFSANQSASVGGYPVSSCLQTALTGGGPFNSPSHPLFYSVIPLCRLRIVFLQGRRERRKRKSGQEERGEGVFMWKSELGLYTKQPWSLSGLMASTLLTVGSVSVNAVFVFLAVSVQLSAPRIWLKPVCVFAQAVSAHLLVKFVLTASRLYRCLTGSRRGNDPVFTIFPGLLLNWAVLVIFPVLIVRMCWWKCKRRLNWTLCHKTTAESLIQDYYSFEPTLK